MPKETDFLKKRPNGFPPLDTPLSLATLGIGAYCGYCNAQGIPFEGEYTEMAMLIGPAAVRGGLCTISDGIAEIISPRSGETKTTLEDMAWESSKGLMIGTVGGAVQTGIGYALGYFVGYLFSF